MINPLSPLPACPNRMDMSPDTVNHLHRLATSSCLVQAVAFVVALSGLGRQTPSVAVLLPRPATATAAWCAAATNLESFMAALPHPEMPASSVPSFFPSSLAGRSHVHLDMFFFHESTQDQHLGRIHHPITIFVLCSRPLS